MISTVTAAADRQFFGAGGHDEQPWSSHGQFSFEDDLTLVASSEVPVEVATISFPEQWQQQQQSPAISRKRKRTGSEHVRQEDNYNDDGDGKCMVSQEDITREITTTIKKALQVFLRKNQGINFNVHTDDIAYDTFIEERFKAIAELIRNFVGGGTSNVSDTGPKRPCGKRKRKRPKTKKDRPKIGMKIADIVEIILLGIQDEKVEKRKKKYMRKPNKPWKSSIMAMTCFLPFEVFSGLLSHFKYFEARYVNGWPPGWTICFGTKGMQNREKIGRGGGGGRGCGSKYPRAHFEHLFPECAAAGEESNEHRTAGIPATSCASPLPFGVADLNVHDDLDFLDQMSFEDVADLNVHDDLDQMLLKYVPDSNVLDDLSAYQCHLRT